MAKVRSKLGVAVILLIGAFAFGFAAISGVFGNTQIGLTLLSNRALQADLDMHITFDGAFEQGTFEFGSGGATTTDPSTTYDLAYDITTDQSGYVYITGCRDITSSFCAGAANDAYYTFKIDPFSGDVIWATTTDPSTSTDIAYAITSDNDGFIYVSGECFGCLTAGSRDHYTFKMDPSDGSMVWATSTDPTPTDNDAVNGIAADNAGNVYVTGSCAVPCATGGSAHYTYKIDGSNGEMLWSTTTNLTLGSDEGEGIVIDPAGFVYVSGVCDGCGSLGSVAHYTYKLHPDDGSLIWSTTTDPTTSGDRVYAITADTEGSLYIAGDCLGCGNLGSNAHYIYKVNAEDASMVWATTTDLSTLNDIPYDIKTDQEGYVYVTGDCNGCGPTGGRSHYTYKIDPSDGSMIWATTTDPTTGSDVAYGLTADSEKGVFVTGSCNACGSNGSIAMYTYKIDPSDGSMIGTDTADRVGSVGATQAPGNIGQGMYFDGVDDYVFVDVPGINTGSGLESMSLWFKTASTSGFMLGSDESSGGDDDGFVAYINTSGQLCAKIIEASCTTDTYNDDTWHHIAITRTATNGYAYYVDGTAYVDVIAGGSDNGGGDDLYIGRDYELDETVSSNYFEGYIDDVRFYERTLSANDVTRLYQLGATTKINKTLDSNPDLQRGLVQHITFDGVYETGTHEFGSGGATTTDPTSNSLEFPDDAVVDESGYLYVAGTCNGCGSQGSQAHYTYKVNPLTGDMVWATTTDPTSSSDYGEEIAIDPDGFLYVVGNCISCGSQGSTAFYTYKVDPQNGDMLWATTTDPTSGADVPDAIAAGADGSVYVGGDCSGCGSQGGDAHYLFKVDPSDGSMIWATTTDPTANFENLNSLVVGLDGFVYATGECVICGSQGGQANYTYKVDPDDGSMIWATTTDPTSNTDRAAEITADEQGGIYVTGDCGVCGPQGGSAYYTYKINADDGSMIWGTTTDPSSSAELAQAVRADTAGNLYVTGYCSGCGSQGGQAHYTLKIDASDGSLLWATTTDPTPNEDTAQAIAIDNDNYPYILGYCEACGTNGGRAHYIYKLDPTDGSMIDTTSTGAIGSLGATNVDGNIGQGITLDGVDDYIKTTDISEASPINNDISVSIWGRIPTDVVALNSDTCGSSGRYLVSKGNSFTSNWEWGIEYDSPTRVCATTWTASGASHAATELLNRPMNDGEWHMYTFTYDYLNEMRFYIDGELVDTDTTFNLTMTDEDATIDLGSRNNGSEYFFDGDLDDYRLYNRVLSVEEVSRLYDLGATTKINTTIDTNPDLKRGLVGHWTFDGYPETDISSTSAEVLDQSGNAYNGDMQNFTDVTDGLVPGVSGQAVMFDGVNDCTNHGDVLDIGTGDLSVAAWARTSGNTGQMNIVAKAGLSASSEGYRLIFTSGDDLVFRIADGATNWQDGVFNDTARLRDGNWHHYVGTVDRDTVLRLYVDGELHEENTTVAFNGTDIDTAETLTIGSEDSCADDYFEGSVDDVRIYNRALSDVEILRLYQLGGQ